MRARESIYEAMLLAHPAKSQVCGLRSVLPYSLLVACNHQHRRVREWMLGVPAAVKLLCLSLLFLVGLQKNATPTRIIVRNIMCLFDSLFHLLNNLALRQFNARQMYRDDNGLKNRLRFRYIIAASVSLLILHRFIILIGIKTVINLYAEFRSLRNRGGRCS